MRRAHLVLPLACLVAFTGCIDAMLDGTEEPPESDPFEGVQESVAGNETNDTNDTGEVTLGPEPVAPSPEPTTAAPTATTPLTPIESPPPPPAEPTPVAPPPPAPTPPPPAPTPPPPTPTTAPTPPPPSPTPPPPTPTPPPPSWPQEGSYVRYRVTMDEGSPDGSFNADTDTVVSWTFTNGDWRGVCEGTRTTQYRDEAPTTETLHREITVDSPPHWPLFNTKSPPAPGGTVTAWFMKGCDIQQLERRYVGTDAESVTVSGATRSVDTHLAEDFDDGSPDDFRTEWSQDVGLVAYWDWAQRNTHTRGDLLDTDAPM